MTLLRKRLEMLAHDWLNVHFDDLPLEGDLPLSWVDELAEEFEAALEDRAREFVEKKS